MSEQGAAGGAERAERMWEMFGRDATSSRRGLNLREILDVAIRLADESGVAGLSMANIARETGYSTMALYRHVSSKAELLQLMVDVAIELPPASILQQSGWRDQMMAWSMEIAARYRRRQWVFDVPLSGPPVLPHALQWMDLGLTILKQTGLDTDVRMTLLSTMTSYLRGNEQILAEVEREAGAREPGETPESYGSMLARMVPPGALPALEEIVNDGVLNEFVDLDSEAEHEMELAFGINLILDGIEALAEQNCGHGPGQ